MAIQHDSLHLLHAAASVRVGVKFHKPVTHRQRGFLSFPVLCLLFFPFGLLFDCGFLLFHHDCIPESFGFGEETGEGLVCRLKRQILHKKGHGSGGTLVLLLVNFLFLLHRSGFGNGSRGSLFVIFLLFSLFLSFTSLFLPRLGFLLHVQILRGTLKVEGGSFEGSVHESLEGRVTSGRGVKPHDRASSRGGNGDLFQAAMLFEEGLEVISGRMCRQVFHDEGVVAACLSPFFRASRGCQESCTFPFKGVQPNTLLAQPLTGTT
mmetsp:Transcript_14236/g.28557  ORF Transcript_14236/g.28557 Transcript_14236/m.28557 type:complete len:264 (+) Transcript_14236:654-1445(+)